MTRTTEKQRKFANEYVKTGNISASYKVAYPSVKKDSAARASGSRLLTKANVRSYIDERLEELKKKSIAEQDEILQFLTSVMRGEHTEQIPIGIGEGAQQLEDKDPFLKDRVKAAELLGKRYVMWTDKQQVETITPVFVEDVPDED
ncbi:terminase small subunit [Rossellomorea aquimaris]|uniref:Terminase small subunit n=1 Tax=Rossellomorea aquimaris TaxID=189382 RepID=A0A5D4UI93_9BACI|nr:terminase small subunit [Rossellomorea aquimaris]TYS77599.1 terminase small subunit [Rossellomorea aquimaris]TYS86780.1 terminase small subunit [Rossellomorea aquimaris]